MRAKDKVAVERYKKKLELIRSAGLSVTFETAKEKREIIERCKTDIPFMVGYLFPHYATSECADFQIEFAKKVGRDQKIKAFCQWGRGQAKSVWNDIIIPFWLHFIMGEPTYLVIIGSSSDKAEQLIEDIKAELEVNPRMIAHFGEQKQLGSWEGKFFVTKGGFIGQALGIGKNVRGLRVRGRRPTLLVIDDIETEELNNNPERQIRLAKWVEKSLIPTMDGPVRRLIYAHNRYAETMVQTILQERHPKWFVHDVPAYDPITYKPTWHQKYPDNYFRDLEDEIGIIAALSEYNNQPHVEGEIFKEEQIQWGDMPALNHFKIIVGHWDVAYAGTKTSDYNAVEIMGLKDKDFWHIDCFVKQCKMRDAIAFMCDVQKNLPKTVIIHWQFEAQFWNDEVERTIDEVQQEMGVLLLISKIPTPTGNKYDRILQLQPRYQNSRIYYNNKKKSHKDTQTGLAQLYATQPGNKKKDDWPDAQHQCIEFLQKYIPMGKASGNFQTGRMLPHNERI